MTRALGVSLAFLALGATGCLGSSDTSDPAAAASPAPAALDVKRCLETEQPAPKENAELAAPETELDPSKSYLAAVDTNCGQFEITLDARRAPKTGGSFAYLAEQGFFDGLTIHRVVPDFVFQGGDPKGDGSGGPGYSVVEPPPKDFVYRKGTVAMAKTPTEAPGTSGSQFFVVTGPGARELPPDYALLGRVSGGRGVVERIGAIITDPRTDRPPAPIVIRSITVHEL